MSWQQFLFGKLSLSVIPTDPIALGGIIFMLSCGAITLGLITYFRLWGWLWREWFTSLDPKKIGIMYLGVSGVMLIRGLADTALMRAQQALSVGADQGILSANHFQQVFSAHGSIMIFFVAMGFMFALINIVLPLIIGARDVAFPFLNALSFWLFAAGAALVNLSLMLGDFSAAGWLAYPPLSELQYSPSVGVDYWIWSLQIAGLGSLLSGINFFTTVATMRAKGMTLMKMPMFAWTVLGAMTLVAFAFPILTVTLALLSLDRTLGMHFFTAAAGGNMMMYVNLIWAWGHPEVYILILPAFGVFSEIVPVFSGKKLAGYTSMVYSIWAIVILSFVVWLHHFFTMGAGGTVNAFFGIMTMLIAIPTGVKIFNWLFTMYRGKIQFKTPMIWFMGFVINFSTGGVSGVLMSMAPIDFQTHNSLFLIAHFHSMVIGGVLFGFFAAIDYWFPKFAGFTLDERLGRYASYFWILGFLLAFMPLYILGLMGATRRLDHYDADTGWQPLFLVAALGALFITVGIGFQLLQIVVSIRDRKKNRDKTGDPWNARTLEWDTSSPPPFYNFAILPHVHDHDPFWDIKQGKAKRPTKYEDIYMPTNTPLGMLIGVAAFLVGFGLIWHLFWLAFLGLVGVIVCMVIRLSEPDEQTEECIAAAQVKKMESR